MPQKVETTHVLMENELVLYKRDHSKVWQCRFKVDGTWQRATTKQHDIAKAKVKAKELMIEAEIRKRSNLPVITRKFRHVAKLAIDRMDTETAAGRGKASFVDYKRIIDDYLIPYFGNHAITNITYALIEQFDAWRIEQMGKAPTHSTLLSHNAALNRVFDEAVARAFLTDANRPKLEAKGKVGDRRPDFDINEVRALRAGFDAWIERGRNEKSKELRALLRDYVDVLLDTGARPGDELLNLKWKQVQFAMKPVITPTGQVDEEGETIELPNLNRSCLMTVSGKTGPREIAGMNVTVKAFERIIKRNYTNKNPIIDPFKGIAIATNDDYVFRTKSKQKPTSLQNLFYGYLEEHNLLIDPRTGQKRVFYSLRHTYATLALTLDLVPLATLTVQMGTSVAMIEKHYSHLKVREAIEQLRRHETRKMLDSGGVIDEIYSAKPKPAAKGLRAEKQHP